jgi:hypothetical protein
MDDPFALRLNIERFQALLRTEQDQAKRSVLEKLLAEAEAALHRRATSRAAE